ncbi:DsbA family protein [Salinarimonas ramus]|uniref:Outer membrane protein n=1 Tax=Salinarimonas ramus TaxID=690164 RepID=A0A917V5L6_9HYPH|nr:DsbA family protein [Salinarimonas ramus]GGK41113.1 outer membrane protein [Salinarimonas ramus]
MTSLLAPFATLRRTALAAVLAAGALATAPAIAQETPFSEAERDAIGEVVREYLLENPELMREVFAELERRQVAEQEARQREAMTAMRDELFDADHDIVLGNPEGDVTLVEFFDYNCGFCKRALGDVMAMIERDPELRVVLKDFPVLGPGSLEAARIGVAATEQMTPEQAERFHMELLLTRGQVDGARALAVAEEMGLDMAALEEAVNGERVAEIITTNIDLADRLGLTGTPAWVVGDGVIFGAVGVERLTEAVANARECGSVSC